MGLIKPTSGEILVDGRNLFDNKFENFIWLAKSIEVKFSSIFLKIAQLVEYSIWIPKELVDLERVKLCAKQAKLSSF